MTDAGLEQLITDVQYLKDRQAILDLIYRQARAHDRHDKELQDTCFWPDGFDEHGQFVTPGSDYGRFANEIHSAGFVMHIHNIANHLCEIDGDTAHAETYVIGALSPRSTPGRGKIVSSRYVDRIERRDGEWRIALRRVTIEMDVEGPSTWPSAPVNETFVKGAWDASDISYARPLQLDTPALFWDGTTR